MAQKKVLIKEGSRLDQFLAKRLSSNLFTYREIIAMLIPIVLDQFFCYAIGIFTTALISSSSQESVTAVSLVNPVQTTVVSAFYAVAAGGTVIVAQYKGKMDEEKTREAAGQVIFGTVVLAIIGAFLLSVFATPIVNALFGSADEVVKIKARDYMVGMSISSISFALYEAAFSIFRGIGKTKTCLWLTLIINLIYLAGQVLFINVLKMDVIGSVVAINIARVIGAAVAMYALMGPHSPLPVKVKDMVPYGMEQIFFNGGSILVQMYMVGLGTAAVASFAVANSALSLLYAAATSAGVLAITICGRCFGAGDKKLTRHYGKQMVEMALLLVVISIVVFGPFMPYILQMYQAPTQNLPIIYRLLLIAALPLVLFFPTANTMPNVLRSAGDSAFSSIVSLITMWVIRVALGYRLGITMDIGVYGIYCAMVIEWAVKTVIFTVRYKGDRWLSKKTIE